MVAVEPEGGGGGGDHGGKEVASPSPLRKTDGCIPAHPLRQQSLPEGGVGGKASWRLLLRPPSAARLNGARHEPAVRWEAACSADDGGEPREGEVVASPAATPAVPVGDDSARSGPTASGSQRPRAEEPGSSPGGVNAARPGGDSPGRMARQKSAAPRGTSGGALPQALFGKTSHGVEPLAAWMLLRSGQTRAAFAAYLRPSGAAPVGPAGSVGSSASNGLGTLRAFFSPPLAVTWRGPARGGNGRRPK